MKLLYSILFMIVTSFFIQYYLMSYIMVNNTNNITNSLGKIYVSIIMALAMGVTEVGMNDFMMKQISATYYVVLLVLLVVFILAYQKQVGITDNEYLKEMIEHHAMALLTSKEIVHKTSNYHIKKFSF